MKYSLLHKIEEKEYNDSVIYDLSIDRSVANFSSDIRKNDYFCRVLSNPLCNVDNIKYRSEILSDFMEMKELLTAVKTLFNRYDKLKGDWLELKSTGETRSADKGTEAMLDYTYSSLKVTALFPKTIMSFYHSIYETLSDYPVKSQGLVSIRDYAKEMLENESLKEIVDIAALFTYNTPDDYDFELICSIGDTLSVEYAQICSVVKREKKSGVLSRFIKKKKDNDTLETREETVRDDALFILGEAMYRIDSVLEEITDHIYDTFYGISRELEFYEVACSYCDFLHSKSKVYCYPSIGGKSFEFSELYDLFLLSEGKDPLYPNDFDVCDKAGVLIRGKNNTGKTTFLRSVGTAQIFAQAGLPVAARSANIPVFTRVFSHFSSAEEEFINGDSSGRFEGEVKAVSHIIDQLTPNCLVILNETFQTTAYDEGTAAIADVLKVFQKLGCRFIFVTHLTDLFQLFGDDIVKLESASGNTPFTIKTI